LALLLLQQPLSARTIRVTETCTLVDGITAANTDARVGGCKAGRGADTLRLTADVSLTAADNFAYQHDNGLPAVSSDITVEGRGFTVKRAAAADPFRIFVVAGNGTLTLNEVTVQNGSANFGAGVLNYGTATVDNSTLSGGHAIFGGGGFSNSGTSFYGPAVAKATITNSTVSGNSSAYYSGGIDNYFGTLSITNSTISDNSAGFMGGGISSIGFDGFGGILTMTNSTLSGNSAPFGDSVANFYDADFTLRNSIVATTLPGGGGNCYSFGTPTITDGGGNFDNDGTCPGAAPITPGVDFDAMLADNGGPTKTHALLPGSPAIDAAGLCGLRTDQRGFRRNDGACDSGSFEHGAPDPDDQGEDNDDQGGNSGPGGGERIMK
jgi:hypothetical protein